MITYKDVETKRKHWDAYEKIRSATSDILDEHRPLQAVAQILVVTEALLKELRDHADGLVREVFTDNEGAQS